MNEDRVEITDEALVPEELCMITVTMPFPLWIALVTRKDFNMRDFAEPGSVKESPRVPSLSLIAEALQKPCPSCDGSGCMSGIESIRCAECGGSGKQSVPGARFRQATPEGL